MKKKLSLQKQIDFLEKRVKDLEPKKFKNNDFVTIDISKLNNGSTATNNKLQWQTDF